MDMEKLQKIKKEMVYLLIIFAAGIIIFKIAFYKEGLFNVVRTVLSIFWLFLLPGYFLLLYWEARLDFIERIVIGVMLGAALIGIFSYYFGLVGIHTKYHSIFLPAVFILMGIFLNQKRNSN